MLRLAAAACVLAFSFLMSCARTPICDGRSLDIVDPSSDETVPEGMVNVVVQVCGFDADEVIRLRLLSPAEAHYGVVSIEDPERRLYNYEVPTLPGTMTFVAEDFEASTVSPTVSFAVEP